VNVAVQSLTIKAVISVLFCLALGLLSGFTTSKAIEGWYVFLEKPTFNPPNWVFGPVWTFLYTIMGFSTAVIWHKGWSRREVKIALIIFLIHLGLNALWTQLFFGMRSPELALVEIVFLFISIAMYSLRFYRLEPWTGWAQIPYLLWVLFATVLNASIVWLN
jgi:tryptophan-rich sensory protein